MDTQTDAALASLIQVLTKATDGVVTNTAPLAQKVIEMATKGYFIQGLSHVLFGLLAYCVTFILTYAGFRGCKRNPNDADAWSFLFLMAFIAFAVGTGCILSNLQELFAPETVVYTNLLERLQRN